uniref:Apple domain-containing protein n=1 Tax=Onchocerca volvulus TaxID=6282 RepID=A0A8R1XSU6_ONCVO
MNWELVVSICQALLVVSMSNQLSLDIYPRLNKGKVDIIAANYKVNDMIKSACWIRINPYSRRAVIEEYGVCRRICKKARKRLKIIETVFCKKHAAIHIKYDFLTKNCSQMSRHQQWCRIQNTSYDNSSDAFPVRFKLHRCRKDRIM